MSDNYKEILIDLANSVIEKDVDTPCLFCKKETHDEECPITIARFAMSVIVDGWNE